MDELKELKRILKQKLVFPYKVVIKNPHPGILSTEFVVDDKADIRKRISVIEQGKRGFYKCWFCNKYFKEDKGGRTLPMDKREAGDGLFGEAFVCFTCVPSEFGRL